MAKGTTFGTVHSNVNLHLIQQSVKISPALPKTNFIDIVGMDGAIDATNALGETNYSNREIEWKYALYPGEDWFAKQSEVSNALNGILCNIVLDEEKGWYYRGRVSVEDYDIDRLLRTITVKAVCFPWKMKVAETTVSRADLSTSYKQLQLPNERRPVVPTITVAQDTTLLWQGNTYTINAGTHRLPDIQLQAGDNILKAKVPDLDTGSITVEYQEASL